MSRPASGSCRAPTRPERMSRPRRDHGWGSSLASAGGGAVARTSCRGVRAVAEAEPAARAARFFWERGKGRLLVELQDGHERLLRYLDVADPLHPLLTLLLLLEQLALAGDVAAVALGDDVLA